MRITHPKYELVFHFIILFFFGCAATQLALQLHPRNTHKWCAVTRKPGNA